MIEATRVKICKIPMVIKWDGPGHYRTDKNFDQIFSGKPIYSETIAELKEGLKIIFDVIGDNFNGTMDNAVISRTDA